MPPSIKQTPVSDSGVLDQLAGLAGVGWTVSVLSYILTVIGYGTVLSTEPRSFLYLGGVLFVATVGLDLLHEARSNGET